MQLHRWARGTFADHAHTLLEAGMDLSDKENIMVQLISDYIFISWMVQICAVVSLKVFWLYLAVKMIKISIYLILEILIYCCVRCLDLPFIK